MPGDHFSLLRQSEEDMQTIVNTLKLALSPFGWHMTHKRDQKLYKRDEVGSIFSLHMCNAVTQQRSTVTDVVSFSKLDAMLES